MPALAAPLADPALAAPAVRRVRVGESGEGQRLDNWLLRELKGVPKTHIYRIVRSGEVRVNGARAQALTKLQIGDEVRVPPVRTAQRADKDTGWSEATASAARGQGAGRQALGGAGRHPGPGAAGQTVANATAATTAPPREFQILYEDDWLLAIDKPAGVAVHGGSGVSFGVIEQLRRARPEAPMLELVHRLDRETSGVLLIAKRRRALTALQQQFRETGSDRVLRKVYSALVRGVWPARRKVLDRALVRTVGSDGERRVRIAREGDEAPLRSVTLVQHAEPAGPHTLLELVLKTGRTHQIRVHLASEPGEDGQGHPILGDDRYGDFALNRALARQGVGGVRLERMFLHARALTLSHPATGESLTIEAPLPRECEALLTALRASGDDGA